MTKLKLTHHHQNEIDNLCDTLYSMAKEIDKHIDDIHAVMAVQKLRLLIDGEREVQREVLRENVQLRFNIEYDLNLILKVNLISLVITIASLIITILTIYH